MNVKTDPVYVRRRRVALAVAVVVVIALALTVWRVAAGGEDQATAEDPSGSSTSAAQSEDGQGEGDDDSGGKDSGDEESGSDEPASGYTRTESPAPKVSPAEEQGAKGKPSETSLVRIQRITGDISPKSVVASDHGMVFAQNMMYSHTITAYNAEGDLLKTIDDSVKLSEFGIEGHPGTSKGAPVEMAFSPDGKTAWVSNYSMYGQNFLPEGKDACLGPEGISDSYLYKIDTETLEIVDAIEVGAVPKYVAATPDGEKVLVTNWCSMDLSVVDVSKGKTVKTIPLGGDNPRGIEVSPDSKTAYVALMGDGRTVSVDLASGDVETFARTGAGPRHLVLSPDGKTLYVTNNTSGTVSKVDAESGEVIKTVDVGAQPRSMTISEDGSAIYVVNYHSASMSKLRTSDMSVMQTVQTDANPIGITYEPTKNRVWVACYGGSIIVFDDSRKAA